MFYLKRVIKYIFGSIYFYSGIFYLHLYIINMRAGLVTILTYHRVTNLSVEDVYWSPKFLYVNKDTFYKQMKFIMNYYSIIDQEELLNELNKNNNYNRNILIVTFDDGYEDNYLYALPVLKELNIKAIIFLAVGKIDSKEEKSYWWDRAYSMLEQLERKTASGEVHIEDVEHKRIFHEYINNKSSFFQKMNLKPDKEINTLIDNMEFAYGLSSYQEKNTVLHWNQILEMKGVFSFGSHTLSHRNLLFLPEKEVDIELSGSKQLIEEMTGEKVHSFSYTAGNYNFALCEKVKKSGYQFAVTTDSGVSDLRNSHQLKRINIWEGASASPWGRFSKGIFALHLTGLLR